MSYKTYSVALGDSEREMFNRLRLIFERELGHEPSNTEVIKGCLKFFNESYGDFVGEGEEPTFIFTSEMIDSEVVANKIRDRLLDDIYRYGHVSVLSLCCSIMNAVSKHPDWNASYRYCSELGISRNNSRKIGWRKGRNDIPEMFVVEHVEEGINIPVVEKVCGKESGTRVSYWMIRMPRPIGLNDAEMFNE